MRKICQVNGTLYGLAAAVFTQSISHALETANKLKAGTTRVNHINTFNASAPFGGFKRSGGTYRSSTSYTFELNFDNFRFAIGRELREDATTPTLRWCMSVWAKRSKFLEVHKRMCVWKRRISNRTTCLLPVLYVYQKSAACCILLEITFLIHATFADQDFQASRPQDPSLGRLS